MSLCFGGFCVIINGDVCEIYPFEITFCSRWSKTSEGRFSQAFEVFYLLFLGVDLPSLLSVTFG